MSSVTSIEWTSTHHPDGTVTPGRTWNPTRRTRGGCHHDPPRLVNHEVFANWPAVRALDWCGGFEPNAVTLEVE